MNISQKLETGLSPEALVLIGLIKTEAERLNFPLYIVGGSVRDLILDRAIKDLDDLPDFIGQRASAALKSLATIARPPGCKRMKGVQDTYRIRIGDYRILYDVDDSENTILVLRVQHRKDAYRR